MKCFIIIFIHPIYSSPPYPTPDHICSTTETADRADAQILVACSAKKILNNYDLKTNLYFVMKSVLPFSINIMCLKMNKDKYPY